MVGERGGRREKGREAGLGREREGEEEKRGGGGGNGGVRRKREEGWEGINQRRQTVNYSLRSNQTTKAEVSVLLLYRARSWFLPTCEWLSDHVILRGSKTTQIQYTQNLDLLVPLGDYVTRVLSLQLSNMSYI